MASWMVHLRIADGLLCLPVISDAAAFVMGNIAPDSGVPNEDWSAFDPPYNKTHFKTAGEKGSFTDVDRFCGEYLSEEKIRGYSPKEYSFFLGYYSHLLTDIMWSEMTKSSLEAAYPREFALDRHKLIQTAKEDWYDLDFLYLDEHPDFRAFSIFENAKNLENVFMDIFAADAFENRRQYICSFYRGDEHGDIHRAYKYLTPERVNAFVSDASARIAAKLDAFPR